MPAAAKKEITIQVDPFRTESTTFCLIGGYEIAGQKIGGTPQIQNRVNEKAKRELLFPLGRRRSAASRAQSLKHDPIAEYRASVYRSRKPDEATLLMFPAPAFHAAMCTAALDIPATKKAEIGRLTWIGGHSVNVFGVPQLFMAIVRNSDQNHTPDIRTRAILPAWACMITCTYITPKLNQTAIINILNAAGLVAGIGDGRQEKGKLNFGQFLLTTTDDPRFQHIMRTGGRQAQIEAMANPVCYDEDSEELLSWFQEEVVRRGATLASDEEDDYDDDEQGGTESA